MPAGSGAIHDRRRRLASAAGIAGVAVICGVSLSLRRAVPLWVIGDAVYDDRLFVRGAVGIQDGSWLGPFDQLTLAKGPGYPVFLAVLHRVGVPTALGTQVVVLVAAAGTAWLVLRLTSSFLLTVTMFGALALNPVFLGAQASRLARDNVYASGSLLVFAAVGLLVSYGSTDWSRRRAWRAAGVLALGVVAGALLAGYWLLREERIWLFPALLVLGTGVLVALQSGNQPSKRAAARSTAVGLPRLAAGLLPAAGVVAAGLLAAVVFGALTATVAVWNRQHYGAALTNDFVSGSFPRAYGRWQSVDAGPLTPYVPISRAQRQAVYRVSPAAAELQASLEGPEQAWIVFGCSGYGICDDIAGGWMPWALRDAATRAGYFTSAPAAQAFFARLTAEIDAACGDGRLRCHPAMPSMLPQPSGVDGRRLIDSTWRASRYTAKFALAGRDRPLSSATTEQWTLFRRAVLGLPATVTEQQTDERAWLAGGGRAVDALRVGFRGAALVLTPIAVFGYLAALWHRPGGWRGGWTAGWVVGAAAGVAALSRIGLLGLVDSTSFPAAEDAPYALPVAGFLIVSVLLGLWLLRQCLARPRLRR